MRLIVQVISVNSSKHSDLSEDPPMSKLGHNILTIILVTMTIILVTMTISNYTGCLQQQHRFLN